MSSPTCIRPPVRYSRRRRTAGAREHRTTYHPHSEDPENGPAETGGSQAGGPESGGPETGGPEVITRAELEGIHSSRPQPAAGDHRGQQYPPLDEDGWDEFAGTGPREQARALQARMRTLTSAIADSPVSGGELGLLVDLAALADQVHAAMLTTTTRIETDDLATRRTGLRLVDLLACETRLIRGERRALIRTAKAVARMPHLARAITTGAIGAGQTRAILNEARRLDDAQRAELDTTFTDHDHLTRLDPDALVDHIASKVATLAPKDSDTNRVKTFERRFLALTPGADGTLSGYFEIDDLSGAIIARALDDASTPLTGPRALTGHAADTPAQAQPDRRTLGRRRADALVRLAEHWLAAHHSPEAEPRDSETSDTCEPADAAHLTAPVDARPPETSDDAAKSPGATAPASPIDAGGRDTGPADPIRVGAATSTPRTEPAAAGSRCPTCHTANGPPQRSRVRPRRARPLLYVWTDIASLVGRDPTASAARLLWDTFAPNPILTSTAVQRLASDARLQFILADHGEILGVAAPVATIPAKVRTAVHARDHGCRFPGCPTPIRETDLHHVTPRARQGHTITSNLVALCRRHHIAVSEGGWKLTMTTNGMVTVRRGRHIATTDPPGLLRL